VSFEVAGKWMSADVINVSAAGSSVGKGESLRDTALTLRAAGADALIIRHPASGAAHRLADWTSSSGSAGDTGPSVINAGDGTHEHPTQALLDVYTLTRRIGPLDGRRIWIVGDVLHSRVARSGILAFTKMGASVTVCGPPTLIPAGIESLGCAVRYDLDRVGEADVIYALRMQNERMREDYVPSLHEYTSCYQINAARLSARQVVMHPGPVNRGVELSSDVADSPQALIGAQVRAGVVVRMAVLYELLAGARRPGGDPPDSADATGQTPAEAQLA
jgi:aspartate carbamoyltransferase catalytic subunit